MKESVEQIIIKAKAKPREDWEAAFKAMHDNGDDKLLIDVVFENEKFVEIINEIYVD